MSEMKNVAFFFVVFLSLFPLQTKAGEALPVVQGGQGYLKPPKLLSGLWENEEGPELFLQFVSGDEYRIVHAETGIPVSYNHFKVFKITDNNLVYAIVRQIKNTHHYDGNKMLTDPGRVREMSPHEIEDASARYFYVLFDLSPTMYYYDYTVKDGYFRVFYGLCHNSLHENGPALSQEDFDRPAAYHWNTVRPGSSCPYESYANSGDRPVFGEDAYVYAGPWNREWLPWEAVAELRKKRGGKDSDPFPEDLIQKFKKEMIEEWKNAE